MGGEVYHAKFCQLRGRRGGPAGRKVERSHLVFGRSEGENRFGLLSTEGQASHAAFGPKHARTPERWLEWRRHAHRQLHARLSFGTMAHQHSRVLSVKDRIG